MMTKQRLSTILARCRFLDWSFRVGGGDGQPVWFQVVFQAEPPEGGERSEQHGRKWLVSEHAVPSEVVKSAFLAVQTALEHEAREAFQFDGKAVFGPHIDVAALHSVAQVHERRELPAAMAS